VTSRTARTLAIATSVLSTTLVPVVLVTTGTWTPIPPTPNDLRQWIAHPISAGFVTALTTTAALGLWLLLATAVLTHAYRALGHRLRWTPTLRLPGPIQSLTAALLGATAVTTATGATAHAAPVTTGSGDLTTAEPTTAAPTDQPHARQPPTSPARHTYTVHRGDSLRRIAARTLGDADRWPEIYALNRGTHFHHVGGTLRNPNLIYPGWTLQLPRDIAPPADAHPAPPVHPPPAPAGKPSAAPQPPAPTALDSGPSDPAPTSPQPSHTTTRPGDDGVTETPPARTPAPASPAPPEAGGAPNTSPATPAPASNPSGRAEPSHGVTLLSGSWIDPGLALAIAAAATLIWAHRRRRYQPHPPSPHHRTNDPDLEPLPAVANRIRHSLRSTASQDSDGLNILDTASPLHARTQNSPSHPPATNGRAKVDNPEVSQQPFAGVDEQHLPPVLVVPALANPQATTWPPAGLGLTGPGAEAGGRGFLTTALADGLTDPGARSQVVIPSPTAATLLGTAVTLPETPRLTITDSLDDALNILEAHTLHRTRLAYQHQVDTIAELRRTHPDEEPQPPILLIADAPASHEHPRIAALLTQGQRLDIHGVLLGAWPDGNTITVDTDGTTTPADENTRHDTDPAYVGRLSVLTPPETIDLLATITAAHHPAPAPTETPPATTGQEPPPAAKDSGVTDEADHAEKNEPNGPIATIDEPTTAVDDSASGIPARSDPDAPAAEDPQQKGDNATAPGRVQVRVLGGARIVDMDTTMPLRAKSLELLVYLIVHDGNATQDNILDDLLPDAPAAKAPHRLHTYVSALRKALARTGGPAPYVTHPPRRYTLTPAAFDTDLWRMRDALRDADCATTPTERTAALQRAVDAYNGALADGYDYEWIEAHREGIRRQALDAHLALATATTDPTHALAVLDAAMRHDPYAEAVYQQAMRIRAAMGHLDEIRALRRTLIHLLQEIDAEPSADTLELADRLITGLHQQRQTGKPHPRNSGRQR
jgi:DNA-binding SARP family transcriptional activator